MGNLAELIKRHEGKRNKPYMDTQGRITIGYGRCLDSVGISDEEALALFFHDLSRSISQAATAFPWMKDLDEARQDVVVSMVFNLGVGGVKKFARMLNALERKNYDRAASEMLSSIWASQVGKRAAELADMMRTGSYV